MSEAIALCSVVYVVSAGLLVAAALVYAKRAKAGRPGGEPDTLTGLR